MGRKGRRKYVFSVTLTEEENDLIYKYCDANHIPKSEACRNALDQMFQSGTDRVRKIEFRTEFELDLLDELIALGCKAMKQRRRDDPEDWKSKSQLEKLRSIKKRLDQL